MVRVIVLMVRDSSGRADGPSCRADVPTYLHSEPEYCSFQEPPLPQIPA